MAEERLQRRLAAILSADVVGYSRLMGIDEAGTLPRLNALRRELIDPAIAANLQERTHGARVLGWRFDVCVEGLFSHAFIIE
jgi:class 3 adenylate cyclase